MAGRVLSRLYFPMRTQSGRGVLVSFGYPMPDEEEKVPPDLHPRQTIDELLDDAQKLRDAITKQLHKIRRDGLTQHTDPPLLEPDRRKRRSERH